jgi:hypothetical protein
MKEDLKWFLVFYNGLETNIEVTECGRVRRVPKDWYGFSKHSAPKYGEVDFSKLKLNKGYKQIGIQIQGLKPINVFVHQLVASVFHNYVWQGHKLVVDHIDSNPLNNHKDNLRVITSRENTAKEHLLKTGLPTGVHYNKKERKYRAQIIINNKNHFLGRFDTPKEASEAYQNKLKTLNT